MSETPAPPATTEELMGRRADLGWNTAIQAIDRAAQVIPASQARMMYERLAKECTARIGRLPADIPKIELRPASREAETREG